MRNRLLILCAALTTLLWLAQLTPYLNVADDSGRYMVLGESLARTGDLRLLNLPQRPLDTLYPPGFPAVIAFWLLVTGAQPPGVVLLVKVTLLLLLLGTLPLMLRLLERSGLPVPYRIAALVFYAVCPATVGYANEVMSEIPLLFLCLASIVAVESRVREQESQASAGPATDDSADKESPHGTESPTSPRLLLPSCPFVSFVDKNLGTEPPTRPLLLLVSLLCAACAFLVRTSGIALLLALVVWLWRRHGRTWGVIAALTLLLVVGGWLGRNHLIIKTHPKLHYSTYLDQFTLRDPGRLNSGRIPLSPRGILSRLKFGLPTYIGLIPRSVLYMMGPPRSARLALFYLAAIPLLGFILTGWVIAWKRGMRLSAGFAALFWFIAAMWPWQSARFLVPLVPVFILFAALAADALANRLREHHSTRMVDAGLTTMAAVTLIYCADVHLRVIRQERRPTAPGYTMGRGREEGAFYASCAWLRHNAVPGALVMGKPAYLLHLYSGHPTTQIEPTTNPKVQEKAYIAKQHVIYLVEDAWNFGFVTHKLLAPYFRVYGNRWQLAWEDPNGTGARIWKRTSGTI